MTKKKGGFTLLEIVIAAFVLTIAILGSLLCIFNIRDLSEISQEKLVAVTDASTVLEEMRGVADGLPGANNLNDLSNTNWTAWANANISAPRLNNATELRLDQENIAVVFLNAGDPRQVRVSVNWNHRGRPCTYQVATAMTDRRR
ncbi:MAG TPA: type II secretion system protein [Candidatus Omnitrophota bacterium]|nr:type II secretion system protein [Candidatus Omnitrophota bacterium]